MSTACGRPIYARPLRPPPIAIWPSNPRPFLGAHLRPTMGDHVVGLWLPNHAVRWPSNIGRPIDSTSCGHLCPQWTANKRPHPPTIPDHNGRPISVHIPRPSPTTMDGQQASTTCGHHWPQWTANKRPQPAATSTVPGRPTLAVRGFHLSATATSIARLGGRPKFAATLSGHPQTLSCPHLHAIWAPNFGHLSAPHWASRRSPALHRRLDYHPS